MVNYQFCIVLDFHMDFQNLFICSVNIRLVDHKLLNKPKIAYNRNALLERDKRETSEIWSYGGWPILV